MESKLLTMLLLGALALGAGCVEGDADESTEGDVRVEGEGEGEVVIDDEAAEDVQGFDLDCDRTGNDSGTCSYDVD
jgi:hypothetical protein